MWWTDDLVNIAVDAWMRAAQDLRAEEEEDIYYTLRE